MIELADFNGCEVFRPRLYGYGGSAPKAPVVRDGEVWMLKLPGDAGRAVSEHVGSMIYRSVGVDAQDTVLGVCSAASLEGLSHADPAERVVVACRDLAFDGLRERRRLRPFRNVMNATLSRGCGGDAELGLVLEAIGANGHLTEAGALERFWDMFIVDALIGKGDRGNGGWGLLEDLETGEYSLAPAFGNGGCLYLASSEGGIAQALEDRGLMAELAPRGASRLEIDGKMVDPCRLILEGGYAGCAEAVLRIVPRIDLGAISEIVESVPCLSETRVAFCKALLAERMERVLLPALEKARKRGAGGHA